MTGIPQSRRCCRSLKTSCSAITSGCSFASVSTMRACRFGQSALSCHRFNVTTDSGRDDVDRGSPALIEPADPISARVIASRQRHGACVRVDCFRAIVFIATFCTRSGWQPADSARSGFLNSDCGRDDGTPRLCRRGPFASLRASATGRGAVLRRGDACRDGGCQADTVPDRAVHPGE